MIKIYETINDARLVTTVDIDGVLHTVTFSGGVVSPQWKAATIQCDNQKLQTALEESSSFGVSYRLKEVVTVKEQKVELQNVTEVFNKQSAIEWLRIKFGMRYPTSTSTKLLEQVASERGYTFLNWIKR